MSNPREPNWNGKIIGECAQCGADIYKNYEFVIDSEENRFCSDDCAIEFHGIRTVDFDYFAPNY